MEITDRTERLLALVLLNQMKGAPQRDKIIQLNLAGFTNVEIADILQTTTAVVAQSIVRQALTISTIFSCLTCTRSFWLTAICFGLLFQT